MLPFASPGQATKKKIVMLQRYRAHVTNKLVFFFYYGELRKDSIVIHPGNRFSGMVNNDDRREKVILENDVDFLGG